MFICFYSHNITLMYVHFIIFFYSFLHSILSQPNKSSRGSRFVAQYEAQRTRRKSKIDMEINVASMDTAADDGIHQRNDLKDDDERIDGKKGKSNGTRSKVNNVSTATKRISRRKRRNP